MYLDRISTTRDDRSARRCACYHGGAMRASSGPTAIVPPRALPPPRPFNVPKRRDIRRTRTRLARLYASISPPRHDTGFSSAHNNNYKSATRVLLDLNRH